MNRNPLVQADCNCPVTEDLTEAALEVVRSRKLTAIIAHRTVTLDSPNLVRALRQVEPRLPIIVVSSIDRTEEVLAAGADTFLHFENWLQVGNVVERVLEGPQPGQRLGPTISDRGRSSPR